MVRVKDCRSRTPSSNRPRRVEFFFSFKIEETCTFTTFVISSFHHFILFVEQKLSLCVKKFYASLRE